MCFLRVAAADEAAFIPPMVYVAEAILFNSVISTVPRSKQIPINYKQRTRSSVGIRVKKNFARGRQEVEKAVNISLQPGMR